MLPLRCDSGPTGDACDNMHGSAVMPAGNATKRGHVLEVLGALLDYGNGDCHGESEQPVFSLKNALRDDFAIAHLGCYGGVGLLEGILCVRRRKTRFGGWIGLIAASILRTRVAKLPIRLSGCTTTA